MNIRISECLAVEKSQVKKNYKSPIMVCYGAVRELTQNGSGQSSESNSTLEGCLDPTRKSNPACLK